MKQVSVHLLVAFFGMAFSAFSMAYDVNSVEDVERLMEEYQSVEDFDREDIEKFVQVQKRLGRYIRSISGDRSNSGDTALSSTEQFSEQIAGRAAQTAGNVGLDLETYSLILLISANNESFNEELRQYLN